MIKIKKNLCSQWLTYYLALYRKTLLIPDLKRVGFTLTGLFKKERMTSVTHNIASFLFLVLSKGLAPGFRISYSNPRLFKWWNLASASIENSHYAEKIDNE